MDDNDRYGPPGDSSFKQTDNHQGYWDNQGQNNYNYNRNSSPLYNGDEGYDNTPMTMGDWLLVLLAAFIPCFGGVILYFIWAFSRSGSINRRNYCRAALIIQGALFVIFLIIWAIVGSEILRSTNYY